MNKFIPLGALALAGTGIPAAVALADDATLNGLIATGIQTLGLASPLVQATAILSGCGLLGWRMWLNRPQPAGNHTTDEIFTLLNSLNDRMDGLQQRMDTHIDQHDRRAA